MAYSLAETCSCVVNLRKCNTEKLRYSVLILDNYIPKLDDWLTVHRNITLVNFQLNAQNFIYIYFFSVALRPNAGHDLLIFEVF